MLKLSGKVIKIQNPSEPSNSLFSVTTNKQLPLVLRDNKAFLVNDDVIPEGFKHYLVFEDCTNLLSNLNSDAEFTILPNSLSYIANDDVIRISRGANPTIKVLHRAISPHNAILITEQCNHYCLMCSQPPKDIDDSWILAETKELIPLIPKYTKDICFTGGEPTLFGEAFLDILRLTKSYLPETSIHILSNGRSFKSEAYTRSYASIEHPDMMVGIPIYSDDPAQHDYIVQAKGAFDETILGILNLKKHNQKVEVRIVIHKQSITRLKQLCEFIGRNLLFVDHVALMGLEMMGFTRANLDMLWIDPSDYRDTLSEAVQILAKYRMNVSVYNHQLCLVNEDILPYYKRSISDWKNEYVDECKTCSRINECGGFFSSGVQHGYSRHLRPFE
jgi:His-Xaa-Ser system radical SAM maturase HxsC